MSGIVGKVMPRPMGDYDATTVYDIIDLVTHNNALWICKKPNTVGVEPSTANKEHWQIAINGGISDANSLGGQTSDQWQAKIDAIIEGLVTAGNAKQFDSYEVDDFLLKSEIDEELSETSAHPVRNMTINVVIKEINAAIEEILNGPSVVAKAKELETPRSIHVDLSSISPGEFNGSEDTIPGVTGVLAVENGGTGASTPAEALNNLGVVATPEEINYLSGVTFDIQTQIDRKADSFHGMHVTFGEYVSDLGAAPDPGSSSTVSRSDHIHKLPELEACGGTLPVEKGGTGATDAATARTNLGVAYGNVGGSVCEGNDPRLSDARTPTSHNHAASNITAGTFGGKMVANSTAVATLGNKQVRNIYIGTSTMTSGTTSLPTGDFYVKYK